MHIFANERIHRLHRVQRAMFVMLAGSTVLVVAMPGIAAIIGQETVSAQTSVDSTIESNIQIVIVCGQFDEVGAPSIERSIRSQSADLEVSIDFHHVSYIPASSSSRSELGKSLLASKNATALFLMYSSEAQVRLQILLKTDEGIEISHRVVSVSGGTPLREALGVIVRAAITTILNSGKQIVESDLQENEPQKAEGRSEQLQKESAEGRIESPGLSVDGHPGRLIVSAGAALGVVFAEAPPWVGMDLCLGVMIGKSVGIHVGYVVFSRVQSEIQNVNLTVYRHPIRFGVAFRRPLRRYSLEGGLSFVWQYAVEQTSAGKADWTVLGDGTELGFSVAGFVGFDVPIHGTLTFFSRLAADVLLYGPEYRIANSQGEQVILRPLFVQPNIVVGVKFYFI